MVVKDDWMHKSFVAKVKIRPVRESSMAFSPANTAPVLALTEQKGCPIDPFQPLRKPAPPEAEEPNAHHAACSTKLPWLVKQVDFQGIDWVSLKFDKIIRKCTQLQCCS